MNETIVTEDSRQPSEPTGLLSRLSALVGLDYVSDDYVAFRIDLADAQLEALEKLRKSPVANQSPSKTPIEKATIDRTVLASYFQAIRDAAEKRGQQNDDLRVIAEALLKDVFLLEDLVQRGVFARDTAFLAASASALGVQDDTLSFVAHTLASPFATSFIDAGGVNTARDDPSLFGSCPKCGSPPALAFLRKDDGKRILLCSLCGDGWEFPRLVCPFCGNDDSEHLRVLFTDKENPRWVESCLKCQRYLKSFDGRRFPEGDAFSPYFEETATLYLDLLAEKEGFIRKLPLTAAK